MVEEVICHALLLDTQKKKCHSNYCFDCSDIAQDAHSLKPLNVLYLLGLEVRLLLDLIFILDCYHCCPL